MRVAAWDIGIRNLSICIMDNPIYNDLNKLIYKEPVFWKVINILEEEPTCNDHGCDLPAKWKNEYQKNFCGRHKNRGKVIKDLEPIVIRNVKEYTPFELQVCLVKSLDKYPEICNVDYMFIENQDNDNPHMKMMASSLFTYYVKQAFVNKNENVLNSEIYQLKYIYYISASKKTKSVPIIGEPFVSTKTTSYAKRKETSVIYCRRNVIEYMNHLLGFFDSHRKKDDLSDSFQTVLAGLWSLHFDHVYPTITPEIMTKYCKIHGISEINAKGKKKTFKQLVKELEDRYIWITN